MFISNYEKEQMRVSIRTLQAQVIHLFDEIKELKASKAAKKKPSSIFRTDEAPWGYKLDGTPKKRPGMSPKKIEEVKNEQPVPV
jgi:hypothetical protein